MIDTFALWTLLAALLFAPAGQAVMHLDQLDVRGRVDSLIARRTPDGFTVQNRAAPGEGALRFVAAGEGAYLVHGMGEPLRLEMGALGLGAPRERVAGERTARAVRAGDLDYVFGREGEQSAIVVLHASAPTRTAAAPAAGAPATPAGAPAKTPSAAAERTTIRGTLHHDQKPARHSIEAYNGATWILETDTGRVSLRPATPAVEAALMKLIDARATLTGIAREEMPDPREAVPTDPTGKPLPRRFFSVEAVKAGE